MDDARMRDRIEFLHDRVILMEKRLRCIQNIASAIGSSLQLDDVLHTVAEQVTAMLDAERATVFLVNDETKELVAKIIIGPGLQEFTLAPGQGVAGWVARTGKTLNVKDAYKDKRFDPHFDEISGFRTRSILCQPMTTYRGKTVGVIQVLNKVDSYFTVEDEHLLSTITTQATISIENSKYFTELHEANLQLREAQENLTRNYARMETLYNIQNQMTQTWEVRSLLRGALKEVVKAIPCGLGAILLAGDEAPTLFVQRKGRKEVEVVSPVQVGGLLGTIVRDGEARCDGDHEVSLPILHPVLDAAVECLVAEPLQRANGEVVGAIALANRWSRLRFTAEDMQIMKIVARQIGVALERLEAHRKLTRENNLALVGGALGGVLHDLKSPMGIISGYVQLMAEEEDPGHRQEQAELVLKQFKDISSMTHEVLAFARGETTLLKRNIYPQKLLGELKPLLEAEFAGHNVELVIDNRCREKLKADEGKLKRLFFNIARNARDAMPDGGTFTIRAEEEGEDVVFRLSDTGTGIPEHIRGNLFQSFVTTGKKEGTGLGLAIVKKIVDQHNGSVSFDTDIGRGTQFTIRLPRE